LLTKEEQIEAIANEKQAARFDDSQIVIKKLDGRSSQIRKEALEILKDMEEFYALFDRPQGLKSIWYQREKLLIPDNRYVDRIRKECGTDYVKQGIHLADKYARELLTKQSVNELLRKRCV
ncbi:MAG: hypothetical protein K2H34_10760, partial [Lachnospiraceae bacterium]|nr:hypothetical protein [Lachnospiraceae bacterium]